MKIKRYYLILSIAVGFFSPPVPSQVEPPVPVEERMLTNQPHPAFGVIEKLDVAVLRYGAWPEKDVSFFRQLETDVKEKLHKAGIKLETPTTDNILTISELRIYISTLSLENSQQYVFHIRTALARAVCLKDKQNPVFKADLWQAAPVMQAVLTENMPVRITELVAEQVDGFIDIYKATNPPGKQPLNAGINQIDSSTAPNKQIEKNPNSTITGYKYVASSSSTVFHKPDCRWAGNISKENLVTYQSREEAIKAGKRPCKTCNP